MSRPVPKQADVSLVKMVLTLTLAGLLSGLALAAVYEATLPRIKENQRRALRRAVFEVVPGAADMKRMVVSNDRLTEAPEESEEAGIYAATNESGEIIGYAIPGRGIGFQDFIDLLFGYDPKSGNLTGMQILESRETPGLGDKIFKDADFVAEFRELAAKPEVVLVPNGTGAAPNEVDAITGATISSRAVVKIINEASREWLPLIEGG